MASRKLKYLVTAIVCSALFVASAAEKAQKPNTLSPQEKKQGFVLLFDGRSLEHFKAATKDEIPEAAWLVKDGCIVNPPRDKRPEDAAGGSIVTRKQYSNFDFRLEYRLDPDFQGRVNSGIKYFAYPNTELGLEYQLFDHDAEVSSKHALADLYDILPAASRDAKGRGQWNQVRIVSKGGMVQHWLNGKKVLEYERGGEKFRSAIAESKFKNRENFGEAPKGHILLQDHGGGIAFRNVKIRTFDR